MKSFFLAAAITVFATSALADPGAYLEVTMTIDANDRAAAAAIYTEFKQPFLNSINGAEQKSLLIRDEDVQVLHGFDTVANAKAYLDSRLFKEDIVSKLGPLFAADPEIRIYTAK